MDKEKFLIKNEYDKDASWAIWDSAGKSARDGYERHKHLADCENIEQKIKPNIVLVGLNQSLETPIIEPFGNFHLFENDIVTRKKGIINKVGLVMDPNTVTYTQNLIYAIKGTEYEGAYMTDIIKHKTICGKVKDIKESGNVINYIKKHPEIELENIEIFKKELKFIGSENPLIIALGVDVYGILSKYFACIKALHYSAREYNHKPKDYSRDFWDAVKNGGTSTVNNKTKKSQDMAYNAPDSKCSQEYPIVEIAKGELERFKEFAPNKNDRFSLGEPKDNGRYIHIKRNGQIIGCYTKRGEEFNFHSSYPYGGRDKKIARAELKREDIISAIEDTPR